MFGKIALKVALYAFGHRDEIASLIKEAIALVEGGKAAAKK